MAKTNASGTTFYRGSFVYKEIALSYILNEEGMVDCTNGYDYQYYLKDHLGNIRSTVSASDASAVQQEQHYYPFGMEIEGLSWRGSSLNKLKYNGKEIQDENLGNGPLLVRLWRTYVRS